MAWTPETIKKFTIKRKINIVWRPVVRKSNFGVHCDQIIIFGIKYIKMSLFMASLETIKEIINNIFTSPKKEKYEEWFKVKSSLKTLTCT